MRCAFPPYALAYGANVRPEIRVPASESAFRLDGKIALVTGAGRGIGRAIAPALANAGAEVILNSRTPAELDAVAGEIIGRGGRARVLPFDVTDSTAVREKIGGLSGLDILVNNAGMNRPQPFFEVDEATLDRLIALNIKASFVAAQTAARRMAEAGAGVIINMSSQMGHVGSERDRTVYVMTKHAVEGLTKAMAVELAPQGRARRVDRADLYYYAVDRAVLRQPRVPPMGRRPDPARPHRHGRGGRERRRVPRFSRRQPRHRLVAARRWRLDRMVIRCTGANS
jgi:NAD(P)-dependent dehydrogenase (short-subunit alcohol dehydrogenase family)